MLCLACQDTGLDSKGKPCYPCIVKGRIKPAEVPSRLSRQPHYTKATEQYNDLFEGIDQLVGEPTC